MDISLILVLHVIIRTDMAFKTLCVFSCFVVVIAKKSFVAVNLRVMLNLNPECILLVD